MSVLSGPEMAAALGICRSFLFSVHTVALSSSTCNIVFELGATIYLFATVFAVGGACSPFLTDCSWNKCSH